MTKMISCMHFFLFSPVDNFIVNRPATLKKKKKLLSFCGCVQHVTVKFSLLALTDANIVEVKTTIPCFIAAVLC